MSHILEINTNKGIIETSIVWNTNLRHEQLERYAQVWCRKCGYRFLSLLSHKTK